MKIALDIPKEFEEHFNNDRFEDSLHRLSSDAHLMAGNYEQETAKMLFIALKNAKEVVRCKDCRYSRQPDRTNREESFACDGVLICFAGFDYVYPTYNREKFVSGDSFCSAGEPRDGDAIEAIPPADVRPVVRAEWRYHPEATWKYECPICNSYVPGKWNYCPECGADMMGGDSYGKTQD